MNDMGNWMPGMTLEMVEKATIQAAFHFYRGNKTQTSIALGCSVRTLDTKLEKYEADRELARIRYEQEKRERASMLERMRGIHPTEAVESSRSSLYHADSGVHLESPTFTGKEPAVPVPERPQVQEMLSNEASTGSPGKGSSKIPRANKNG
jgi:hypothetical protein